MGNEINQEPNFSNDEIELIYEYRNLNDNDKNFTRQMITITFLLLDCFIIPKWINSPTNILTEIISNVKILLVIAVVLGLILYISKKNRNYEQISKQEIEKLKLQAQRSQSISKLKTEYIATIKNLVLGLFLILFLFGICKWIY